MVGIFQLYGQYSVNDQQKAHTLRHRHFVYRKSNCIGLTDNNVPVAMLLDNAPHDNFKELIADQFIQVVIFVLIIFLSSNLRIYLLHQNVYVLECELFVDYLQITDHKV